MRRIFPGKVHKNLNVLLATIKIMYNKRLFQMRVFSDTVNMETETIFHEDGRISTFPCSYELGQQITLNGGVVKMKAKVMVDPDGNTSITPYHTGSGERYRRLFNTHHGEVKETKEDIIVKFQFPKRNGRLNIADMLEDEMDDIIDFIETTEEIKEWQ